MNQVESRKRPVFLRGWIMVIACLVGISTGPAAFTLGSMGLFLDGFSEEFGWNRAEASSALSLLMVMTAVSMPFAGKLIDRFGIRFVLIPSVTIFGLLLLSATLITELWQLIAVYGLIGSLAVGSNSVGYVRLLAGWFDRRRGLAIGIAGSGTGLGFAYVPVITQAAVSQWDWRGGYAALSLVVLLIALPLAVFVLKERPEDVGLSVDGVEHRRERGADELPPSPAEDGETLWQALKRADFWFMALTFMSVAFVLYGIIPHLVPMLEDRGFDSYVAAWIASLFGLSTFGGRILIGWLIDHYEARLVAFVFFLLSAGGIALLTFDLPFWAVLLSAILLGGSLGAEVDMLAYLTSRYFGLRSFGQIFATIFGMVMLSMGLGPWVFGAVFEATGSYVAVMAAGVPACLLAMILVRMLPPRPVKRASDLRATVTPRAD